MYPGRLRLWCQPSAFGRWVLYLLKLGAARTLLDHLLVRLNSCAHCNSLLRQPFCSVRHCWCVCCSVRFSRISFEIETSFSPERAANCLPFQQEQGIPSALGANIRSIRSNMISLIVPALSAQVSPERAANCVPFQRKQKISSALARRKYPIRQVGHDLSDRLSAFCAGNNDIVDAAVSAKRTVPRSCRHGRRPYREVARRADHFMWLTPPTRPSILGFFTEKQ